MLILITYKPGDIVEVTSNWFAITKKGSIGEIIRILEDNRYEISWKFLNIEKHFKHDYKDNFRLRGEHIKHCKKYNTALYKVMNV